MKRFWIVKADYPTAFGERTRPDGRYPITRAKLLSQGSIGDGRDGHSWFCAEVEAENEETAIQECMVLISRWAAWRNIPGEPVVSAMPVYREDAAG
jgi:hypothetical protein